MHVKISVRERPLDLKIREKSLVIMRKNEMENE